MSQDYRLEEILRELSRRSTITVEEAVALCRASPATIRRDFNLLAERGDATKTWGGLASLRFSTEATDHIAPLAERVQENREAKAAISKAAADLVSDGQTIFVDGGSTTALMAYRLYEKKIKIVTNSIELTKKIDELRSDDAPYPEIFLTGGFYFPKTSLIMGPKTVNIIRTFQADLAFISVAALDEKTVMSVHQQDLELKREMLKYSRKGILLADHSKFGLKEPYYVCDVDVLDVIITNTHPHTTERLAQIEAQGVSVLKV